MYMTLFSTIKPFLKPNYIPYGMTVLLMIVLLAYFLTQYKEGFDDCNPAELKKRLVSPEKTLVLFYADWCGHCKTLKPVWTEAAEKSNGKMIQLDVGSKDGSQTEILDKYNIDGFPTILVFQNGKTEIYKGPRTVDDFLATLN